MFPALLLISLAVPVELSILIGDFRVSLSRLLLLLAAIPVMRKYMAASRKKNYEYLLLGYIGWLFVSSFFNHGLEVSIERAGSLGLEALISFFVAAFGITNVKRWISTVKVLVAVVFFIFPFVLVEALIGKHFIHDFLSLLTGYIYPIPYEERLGLMRSSGPFNHPILLGVFSATLIGMVWYGLYSRSLFKKAFCITLLIFNTLLSLSSAPVLLVFFQVFAIAFNRIAGAYKSRWKAVIFCAAIIYFVLLVVSNRSPFMVILSRITLDPSTSFYRLLTWQYAGDSVISHPFFGVGMNEWARPAWMITSSIDSFWLKTAVLYGIPAVVMLTLSTLILTGKVVKLMKASKIDAYRKLCVGWIVSIVSLVLLGFTVDFFGEIHIYFFFLLGMGASLVNMKDIRE